MQNKGSATVYVMMALSLCLFAGAIYALAKIEPTNPYTLKKQYERLYIDGKDDVNRSDFEYEDDIYGLFGDRVDDGSGMSPQNRPKDTPRRYIGEEIPVSDTNKRQVINTAQEHISDKADVSIGQIGQHEVSGVSSVSSVPPPPQSVLNHTYVSTLNSRITFPIPQGADVKEWRTDTGLAFSVPVAGKVFTIYVDKSVDGCSSPLTSFALKTHTDYRILYAQEMVTLPNTYTSIIAVEEYGLYKGSPNFRGIGCVQSPVATKIDIHIAHTLKNDKDYMFALLEHILTSLTV